MPARSQTAGIARPFYRNGKEIARQIFVETMAEIDIRRAMLRKVRCEGDTLEAGTARLALARPPLVVALGKAATRMAAAIDEILGGQIERGVVIAPGTPHAKLGRFEYFEAGHPYPTAGSIAGAEAALELVRGRSHEDAIIFLISGGGSALFEKPLDPTVTLADLVELNHQLVTGGLAIEKMNVIRKHLSAVKGGRLALAAYPTRQLTIFISDVPDHLPSMVASGPTMPDESTVENCCSIAREHALVQKFPPPIRRRFERRDLEETPKPGDDRFLFSQSFCLLSNRDATEAACAAAARRGFLCEADPASWDGDYRAMAERDLASLEALCRVHPDHAVALATGGEVTCSVTGSGMGGRNQAYVLYATTKIQGQTRVVLSAGTDGRDGNSPSAGAVADGQTLSRARALRLDLERFLAESDSYYFFRTLGDNINISVADHNVGDVRLWLDFGK